MNAKEEAAIAAAQIAAETKALFAHLVSECGGIAASALRLGISHQRVSDLQSNKLDHARDVPTMFHIAHLEAWIGQDIVTGAIARRAKGGSTASNPIKEAVDVANLAPRLAHLEVSGADAHAKQEVLIQLRREIDEYEASAINPANAA